MAENHISASLAPADKEAVMQAIATTYFAFLMTNCRRSPCC
ncbi:MULTISPECIES: hypothetical protein [unclassified Nostoc]|nr:MULTISPECIES: hypothetical protein [unclassified Nostoc]